MAMLLQKYFPISLEEEIKAGLKKCNRTSAPQPAVYDICDAGLVESMDNSNEMCFSLHLREVLLLLSWNLSNYSALLLDFIHFVVFYLHIS